MYFQNLSSTRQALFAEQHHKRTRCVKDAISSTRPVRDDRRASFSHTSLARTMRSVVHTSSTVRTTAADDKCRDAPGHVPEAKSHEALVEIMWTGWYLEGEYLKYLEMEVISKYLTVSIHNSSSIHENTYVRP